MNNYELVLILRATITPDEQKNILSKVEKSLTEAGGKVETPQEWGKKILSYPIKKLNEGLYFLLKFSSEPKIADEVNKNLRIDDSVVRHLLIRL